MPPPLMTRATSVEQKTGIDSPEEGAHRMTVQAIAEGDVAAHERARLRRNVIVAALALGVFLAALDNSIVNAILPVVAAAFGTDLTAIEWAVTVYLLVQSAIMLAVGRLGDMWGHRNV